MGGLTMAKGIDRRTARTQKALHNALMSLIVSKGYEAITVQDIIDEADVGRSTFYAHYTGKEDLLRSGFAMLREELEAAHLAGGGDDGPKGGPLSLGFAMLEHAGRYRHVYRSLLGVRGRLVADREIRRILSTAVEQGLPDTGDNDAVPRELRVDFVVDTLLNVLGWWFERKPKLPADEVDAIFRSLVTEGIGRSLGRR